jgi:hypothetical protein
MPLLLQNLRDTNRRLSFWLDGMIAGTGRQAVAAPDHMGGLLSELLRAGATFRAEPIFAQGNDPELDAELEKYRSNVERLREVLPSIHGQLLAERGRIEAQRSRVKSAAEWARASRQIL